MQEMISKFDFGRAGSVLGGFALLALVFAALLLLMSLTGGPNWTWTGVLIACGIAVVSAIASKVSYSLDT